MKHLTPDEIRSQFNAASSETDTLFTHAIAAISAGIDALNKEGIDCELTLFGCATEHGFQLHPGDNVSTWSQKTGGILRIGNSQHLVSVVTQVKLKTEGDTGDWHQCLLFCLSKLDIRHQGQHSNVRTNVYQIVEGSDGLRDLQAFIISKAGDDAAIAAHDTHGAFKRGSAGAARTPIIGKKASGA